MVLDVADLTQSPWPGSRSAFVRWSGDLRPAIQHSAQHLEAWIQVPLEDGDDSGAHGPTSRVFWGMQRQSSWATRAWFLQLDAVKGESLDA